MTKKKHRKLFPMFASETNKDLDCSIGICDTTCPQPSTAPSPAISAVYQDSENPSSSLDASTITITTVTGAILLILLAGFCLAAKFVSDNLNRVEHERYQSEDTVEEEFQDREQQMDHPIWLIRTTGLQQSIINSIMIRSYKKGDGLIERTDCPVCLNEFEEDESLRLLPKCNHAFHISCIDTWLTSHTNCPLCRAGISISGDSPRWSGPVVVTPGESVSDPNSDARVEISGFVDEINRNSEEIDGDGLNQSQDYTRQENRPIGDEASCSEENGGQNVKLQTSSDSIDSGESNGEAMGDSRISQSGISSKSTGSSSSVSCLSKNKSLIFPLK